MIRRVNPRSCSVLFAICLVLLAYGIQWSGVSAVGTKGNGGTGGRSRIIDILCFLFYFFLKRGGVSWDRFNNNSKILLLLLLLLIMTQHLII